MLVKLLIYLPVNELFDCPEEIDDSDDVVDDGIFEYDNDIESKEINSARFSFSTINFNNLM